MDFGQGDGGFVAGERTMSSLLNELGDHRQRNNHNSNNSSGVLAPGSGNPLKLCRSASDMDFYKSREGDDHDRSGEGQGPMKLSRTDSFPFNLKMHSQHQQQQVLRNSNGSISSEGRLGYSPSNSGDGGVLFKNDPLSVVSAPGFYGESGRTGNGGGHSLLQPYYSFKTAGGAALSMPLSIGRAEATLNNNNNNNNLGMGMMHGSSVQGSRFCFTPAQWQELEHQALIFKYMMAGVPVPTDLLIPIRKSVAELNTLAALSAPGSLHHHHPTMGWSSFNLRFANNTDPEPGRCRRTDGKKWRCSRDVAPDQKYCERHMHRGRPRSRKLVEAQTAMNTNSSNNNANNPSSTTTQAIGGPNSSSSATSSIGPAAGRSSTGTTFTNLRPPFSMNQNHNQNGSSTLGVKTFSGCGNVGGGGGGGMSINGASGSQFNKPPLHMVSAAASAMPNKDYRYMNWMKGDMDEQMLFSDAKGLNSQDSQSMNSLAMLNNTWRLMPSKVPDPKLNANANNNNTNNNASFLQYTSQLRTLLPQDFGLMPETNQMNLSIQEHQQQQQQRQQHSFLSSGLGAVDSVNVGRDQCSEGQPLRHFFDDWPRNTSDPSTLSWSDMEERSNSSSNTQLSISLPMTITDFPGTNSSSPRGKLSLSSLKLSMSARSGGTEEDPIGVDPTQMGLGVGMGLGLMNEDRHRQTNNNGWIPVTWQSPVGGPLAEVLQSSTNGGGIPPRGCKTSSGLNLMSDGWDLSPHGSPRMASPTGVLQKTFASLSDSSSGSSPRAVAAAAAKHETSLQHTLGGV